MKKNILKVLQWVLMALGGIALTAIVGIIIFLSLRIGPGNRTRIDTASTRDVRFVLNWCELGEGRIEKVVHSYVSKRSLTGDHLDTYAIKISHVSLAELSKLDINPRAHWYRGDQLPKVLDDAVKFSGMWFTKKEIAWFPSETEIRSNKYFVYPWKIEYFGMEPSWAQLIFIRPSDNMIFYFSAKT